MFAHATTASEWEEQGDFFLKRKIYSIAKTCYQKANAIEKRHAVDAYVKIEDIQRSERPPRVKCEEYIKAGELFLKAGKYEPAAKCLYNGKEFTLAAELWRKMGQVRHIHMILIQSFTLCIPGGSFKVLQNHQNLCQRKLANL